MNDSKNEGAWRRLFKEYGIDDAIKENGQYIISSKVLNNFREARLMTKFDHRFQLPKALVDRNLTILPISRGEYILSDIEIFENFTENPKLAITEFSMPPHIKSLNFSTITSEALATNCAYVSGIIADFTQDENLIPTISGRMSSRSFDFNIQKIGKKDEYLHIDVQNAQIEIDGGYEGATSLNLIEAKNSLSSDFLIRQLYYPYRLWHDRLDKKVRPIFLTYTNGIFHLREYQFDELLNYNSIRLIKEKKYRLKDDMPGHNLNIETIQEILHTIPIVDEPADVPFPQANSFERIINLCEILYGNTDENYTEQALNSRYDFKEEYSFDMRQVYYYADAAIYLGLVKKVKMSGKVTFELTPAGYALFKKGSIVERQLMFIKAVLAHRAFNKTLDLYLYKEEEPTKSEIVEIMKASNLHKIKSEDTLKRRASTILSWINWILSTVEA